MIVRYCSISTKFRSLLDMLVVEGVSMEKKNTLYVLTNDMTNDMLLRSFQTLVVDDSWYKISESINTGIRHRLTHTHHHRMIRMCMRVLPIDQMG